MKFNVDGTTRGKPGPTSIGGVLRNNKWIVLAMFLRVWRCIESNEVEAIAILEALQIFSSSFSMKLVVEK